MPKLHHLVAIFIAVFLAKIEARGGQSMLNGTPSEHVPFMVSVRQRVADEPFGSGHLCGGTIVARNFVLTAASCIRSGHQAELAASEIVIIAGTNMRYNQAAAFTLNVRAIFIHPDYSVTDRANNVALIETLEMPRNSININRVVINREPPMAGDFCEIYGFGQARSLTGPPQLLRGSIQMVDTSVCHERRSNMLCSNSNVLPCNGDEGGPVICDNRLSGVIDHSNLDDCRIDAPTRRTSYINASPYQEWIELHLADIGFSSFGNGSFNGTFNNTFTPFTPFNATNRPGSASDMSPLALLTITAIFINFLAISFFN